MVNLFKVSQLENDKSKIQIRAVCVPMKLKLFQRESKINQKIKTNEQNKNNNNNKSPRKCTRKNIINLNHQRNFDTQSLTLSQWSSIPWASVHDVVAHTQYVTPGKIHS